MIVDIESLAAFRLFGEDSIDLGPSSSIEAVCLHIPLKCTEVQNIEPESTYINIRVTKQSK